MVTALDRALETVQHQDVELASMVIADDDRIDGRYLEVHQGILSLLALQAPVAGDLRVVAALLHVIKHVERMGDQCVNMAKLVPLAGHEPPADPQHARATSSRWATRRGSRSCSAGRRSRRRDVGHGAGPGAPGRRDRPAQPRRASALALELGDDADRREWAMHMMLVGRCIERIGDNAVDIGEQTAFVVTGLFREFEDASHPELARAAHCLICACIDIGSNTTRLLVADAGERTAARAGHPARVHPDRQEPPRTAGSIPPEKIAETAEVVRTQATVAREVGAEQHRGGGHRRDPHAPQPRGAARTPCQDAGGMELSVLSGEEEARLSFVGATRTLLQRPDGHDRGDRRGRRLQRDRGRRGRRRDGLVGVVPDRLGLPRRLVPALATRPRWTSSRRCAATWRARSRASSRRRPTSAVAVGGTATSLRRLVGAELAHETLERGIRVLSTTPIARGGRALRARPRARAAAAGRASWCSRRSPTCSSCRCGSRAAACARACCSSSWRAGGLPRRGLLGDRASSRGRRSTLSSPCSMPASPPFFMRTCAPVRAWTAIEKSGSCPTSSTSSPRPAASASASNGPPASFGSSCGSTPPARSHASVAVSAARTFGLVRQASIFTPSALRARPAARDCSAPFFGERTLRVGRSVGSVSVAQQPEHAMRHHNG